MNSAEPITINLRWACILEAPHVYWAAVQLKGREKYPLGEKNRGVHHFGNIMQVIRATWQRSLLCASTMWAVYIRYII